MIAYAVYLALGYTIKRHTVKSGTIDDYLRDAARWIAEHRRPFPGGADKMDPRYDPSSFSIHSDIKKITAEVKRWERDPKRRNPFTKTMLLHLLDTYKDAPAHGLTGALKNWFTLALYIGPRLTEWAQNEGVRDVSQADKNIDGTNSAFTVEDFEFFGQGRTRISHLDAIASPHLGHSVDVTWCFQKNGCNGQKKTVTYNPDNPKLCGVRAAIAIVERSMLLKLPLDHPLAVYVDDTQKSPSLRFITATEISAVLQLLARAVYDITSKDELRLYSSHSLRVGACVALHTAGLDAMSIKFALRWNSDAFLMYLRNITLQAQQVSTAIANFNPDVLNVPL